ncbi:MAG: hypothetical protein J6A09_03265 [Alphaproteobacteria bacterium]|nr:hypothetical protein [Alphaproteobacteria bacterium]
MSIKDKIRSQLLKLGVAASTLAPMAPTSAEAATPEAPEQPKTEQYAPNQELDNNNDGKTSNGFRLTPIDQNSPEARKLKNGNTNTQQPTRRQTVTQQQTRRQPTAQQTQSVREAPYGSPEWLEMNGYIYDHYLSHGLDHSPRGFLGAFYTRENPEQIIYLPADPMYGKTQYNMRANAIEAKEKHMLQYKHRAPRGYEYGTPHRGRPSRAERIVHGAVTVGAIIDAATRSGR